MDEDDPEFPIAANVYINTARLVVHRYYHEQLENARYPLDLEEVYVVWFSKTLKNWKALVSTTQEDALYYEVTHNGYDNETYLDVYAKMHNETFRS